MRTQKEAQAQRDTNIRMIKLNFLPASSGSLDRIKMAKRVERLYELPMGSPEYQSEKSVILGILNANVLGRFIRGEYEEGLDTEGQIAKDLFVNLSEDLDLRELEAGLRWQK